MVVAEWKDSHWCTQERKAKSRCSGKKCQEPISREIIVRKRGDLLLAHCGGCGKVRRIFHSKREMDSHIRLLRLNVHRF